MSIVQAVAEWVHSRAEGAISADVAAVFTVSTSRASMIIAAIHREPRFTTRVEPCRFCNARGATVSGRRLYVDQVNQSQWECKPVIGTYRDGQAIRFDSIQKAHQLCGFDRGSISRCLRGKQQQHRGYRWAVASNEQQG